MVYTITLTDLDGNTYSLDDQSGLQIVREHTALSDWKVNIPYNLDLEEWRFSEVDIQEGGARKFKGYLEVINSREAGSKTTLSGRGRGKVLIDGEAAVTYTNTSAAEAIEDYWNNYTNFSATVDKPTVDPFATDRLVLSCSSTSSFENALTVDPTDPIEVTGDQINLLQSAFTRDARYWDDQSGIEKVWDSNEGTEDLFTDGTGISLKREGSFARYEFDIDYKIPEEHVALTVRDRIPNNQSGRGPRLQFKIDGNVADEANKVISAFLDWSRPMPYYGYNVGYDGGDLEPGTHTVELAVEETGSKGQHFDLVTLYDDRFLYNWPNSLDANDQLSGPEALPHEFTVEFDGVDTGLNVTDVEVQTNMDDTSNNQAISVDLDTSGGTETVSATNTETLTKTFANDGAVITPKLTLSRYGSQTDSTPTQGTEGQKTSVFKVYIDANDKRLISERELNGTHLENLQTLHELANMRFSIDHTAGGLEVESYPRGKQATQDWDVLDHKRKIDVKGYANRVKVRGKRRDDGSRPVIIKTNDGEVSRLNNTVISYVKTDPQITSVTDADGVAEALIREKSTLDRLEGGITVAGPPVEPGKSYYVADWDLYRPAERVTWQESGGQLQANIDLGTPESLGRQISTVRREGRKRGDAI
jgi:hypothetical protein